MSDEIQKNVLVFLEPCSKDPLTGWFRDGYNTDKNDGGVHKLCEGNR